MRANRSVQTGPEILLRRALRAEGVVGYRLNVKGLQGRPDLAFPRERVAIFVNGCFWHHHGCSPSTTRLPTTNRLYWRQKFKANRARDRKKSAALQALGWTPVTYWECEIASNPVRIAQQVRLIVRQAVGSTD
ncbi:MAG: very short patch repair endonuclease [Thermoplasmata archaeon]